MWGGNYRTGNVSPFLTGERRVPVFSLGEALGPDARCEGFLKPCPVHFSWYLMPGPWL